MKKPVKNRVKQYENKNFGEISHEIVGGVAQSLLGIATKVDMDQMLGFADPKEKQKQHHASGDLSEGKILDLRKIHEEDQAEAKAHKEAGIDYHREIVHVGEQAVNRENRELENQLREIMTEVKKLADSSKELQMQFKEVAVEQHAVKPGKYHKTFFSWLLNIIRAARMKVEDSGAWLAAMQSKKKSRQYGAMAKKHGTSFSLSNERNVATQVG